VRRIIENPKEARAFLENLGVTFDPLAFPIAPRPYTSQDLTCKIFELAHSLCGREVHLSGVYPQIGAIVTIAQTPQAGPVLGRNKSGRYHRQELASPPSLASKFTAQLGPILYHTLGMNRNGSFGKFLRYFAAGYDLDEQGDPIFGVGLNVREIAGHRIVFFAESDGETDRELDTIARIAKALLAERVQGEAMRPTDLDELELTETSNEYEKSMELHALIASKRAALTAGFVFLVNTRPEEEIVTALEHRLGFRPTLWTFYDAAPKTG